MKLNQRGECMNTIKRNVPDINTDLDNYNKYFNMLSWKGIIDNKNIFAVDQNSFADAKNVYIDEDYRLVSRKPIRDISSYIYSDSESLNSPLNSAYTLKELYAINGSKLYVGYRLDGANTIYEISFYKKNSPNGFDYKILDDILSYHIASIGPYVICFNDKGAKVIDSSNSDSDWEDLDNYAYIPIYKTVVGTVATFSTKNLFTESYKEQYIYSNNSQTIFPAIGSFVEDNVTRYRELDNILLSTTNKEYSYNTVTDAITYNLPREIAANVGDIGSISINDIFSSNKVLIIDKKQYALISLDGGNSFSTILYPDYDKNSNIYITGLSDDAAYYFLVVKEAVYRLNLADMDWTVISYSTEFALTTTSIPNSGHFRTGDIFGFLAYKQYGSLYAYMLGPDISESNPTVKEVNLNLVYNDSIIINIVNNYKNEGRYYTRSVLCQNILNYNVDITYFLVLLSDSDTSSKKLLIIDKDGVRLNTPLILGNRFVSCSATTYISFAVSSLTFGSKSIVSVYDYSTDFTIASTGTVPTFNIYLNRPLIADGTKYEFDEDVRLSNYCIISSEVVIGITSDNLYFKTARGIYTLPSNFSVDSIVGIIADSSYSGIWYGIINNKLYSNILFDDDKIIVTYYVYRLNSNYALIPDCSYSDSELYFSIANTLYVTSNIYEDGVLKLAVYPINIQQFSSAIHSLINISTTEVAIFFANNIAILSKVEDDTFGYRYDYKNTRLSLGIDFYNSPINTIEGSNTFFPTRKGLASMTYQEFLSTNDQIATYLTSSIENIWTEFYNSGKNIRLLQHKDHLLLYNGTNIILLYDFRNSSWWKWELPIAVKGIYSDQVDIFVISDGLYDFYDNERYLDLFGVKNLNIEWYFITQPLHMDAPNYYKNLRQLIFHLSDESDKKKTIAVQVKLYRDKLRIKAPDSITFKIDEIGQILKRFNYWKIHLVQLAIASDSDNVLKYKLQLHGLSIKYEIGYEIR